MKPPVRLRIGVIGCGGIGQMMHLPHLREMHDRFDLVALSDVNLETLSSVGDYFGVSQLHADYHDLIASDVDAVMILTGGSHAAMAIDAAQAGKHVFVEKPLCYTVSEVDRIEEAVASRNVKLMVGYMKRYDPAFRYAQRAAKSMHDVRWVRITVLHPASELYFQHHVFHPPASPAALRTRELAQRMVSLFSSGQQSEYATEILGSEAPSIQRTALGLMLGSLCHDVNALRGLMGEPSGVAHTELWNDGLAMSSTLRYPGDVRATITWTYLSDLRNYDEEIAVFADAARLRIVFPSPFLRNYATRVVIEGSEPLPDRSEAAFWEKNVTVSYHEAFKEELLHFYDSIVQDEQPLTGVADSRADVCLIHAMARAWRP